MEPAGLFEWTQEYELGIEIIDRQHKDLINVLNDVYSAIYEGDNIEKKLPELLNALEFYISEHMDLEENYAEKYNFPKANELIESHNFFKTTYSELRYYYYEKPEISHPTIQKILHLHSIMHKWLRFHLKTLDKELCEFLKEKLEE